MNPGPGKRGIRAGLIIERQRSMAHTTSRFIRAHDWAGECQERRGAMPACRAHLVGMSDGVYIALRLSSEEDDDPIAHVDSGILIEPMRGVRNSISLKDQWGGHIDGR